MVNLDRLRVRGLRAYERGRLRTAARVGMLLVPVSLLCWVEGGARESCACLSALLLGAAIWLRWRSRQGSDDVTTGLLVGSIPVLAGLVLARVGGGCSNAVCSLVAGAAGFLGGGLLALREGRGRAHAGRWLLAGVIGTLLSSLACLSLGAMSVVGAMLGIAAGAAAGLLILRRAGSA